MPGTPADAEAISALILELSGPFFLDPSRAGAEAFLASAGPEALRRYLHSDHYAYYVATSQGRLAGVVALRDHAHLFHLFVAEPFQGQRLARRLWQRVQAGALRAGNPGRFTVNASLNAVGVYKRFGFVCQGDVQRRNGIAFQPMCLESGGALAQQGQAAL